MEVVSQSDDEDKTRNNISLFEKIHITRYNDFSHDENF